MKIIGVICEYNPFHLGHQKQFTKIRAAFGPNTGIVCLMSGNYVQRGHPAIFDKALRAKAAILGGADLVLELPVPVALSSAEGFAAGGVKILSGFCDGLSFGTETGTAETLMQTAQALLRPEFSASLREYLDRGLSFPAARQAALGDLGGLLSSPNDILAVEYCKAILAQGSPLAIAPIRRRGSYHDTAPDPSDPSATALRQCVLTGEDWRPYVPEAAHSLFANATVHTLAAGERAVLARLRTMEEVDFEALPYGSEGLWRKLMHSARSCATLEEIAQATKSKRYTRTRIDRMLLCAYLGITQEQLTAPPPPARVLALNDTGRQILKRARQWGAFPHTGEPIEEPWQSRERRWEDLYGLFAANGPEAPGKREKRRIFMAL